MPVMAQTSTDLAKYAGPYDFIEKDLKENVTVCDYLKLAAVIGALPVVISYKFSFDQMKFGLHKLSRDPRYKRAKRTFYDSAMDAASDFLAFNLNWRQLRVITGVRPLREELKRLKIKGHNHYNYYFGGKNYSARWLHEVEDRKPEDPVILYIHGGSYAIKTQNLQIYYMSKLTKRFKNYRVSTLILDFTIGEVLKWPAQLNEGMACYNDLKQSCNNIVAFGDSCGGHMMLAMLLSGASFSACMFVSPTTDLTGNSHDEITMRQAFLTDEHDVHDPMLSPVLAGEPTWRMCLPQNTAMMWGSNEECVRQMKEFIDASGIQMYFEEVQGGHDCMIRGHGNPGSDFIIEMMETWFFNET